MKRLVVVAVAVVTAASGWFLLRGTSLTAATTLPPVAGHVVVYPIPQQDGVRIDRRHGVALGRWRSAVCAYDLSGSSTIRGTHRPPDRFDVEVSDDAVTVALDLRYRYDRNPLGWSSAMGLIE